MSYHPCQGCKHSFIKLRSPDGKSWTPSCRIYTGKPVQKKCADFHIYSVKPLDN